jgi:hypothetical protein
LSNPDKSCLFNVLTEMKHENMYSLTPEGVEPPTLSSED